MSSYTGTHTSKNYLILISNIMWHVHNTALILQQKETPK